MNQTEKWHREGYLVFRNLFDAALIAKLQEACNNPLDQWQRESVAEGEPGMHCYGPTAWVMLHLNHPKYHRQHPECLAALLNTVADPSVLRIRKGTSVPAR